MGEASTLIELGQVGAPFGVRGWVKLRSFTEPPERILEHRRLQLGRGGTWNPFTIEASGRSGGRLTVKLSGVEDRDQAQALRGATICIPRSELPQRSDKDFYRADLIGCEVVTLAEVPLGTVQHFIETPAHALMVVRGDSEYWIPAVPRHLRRVDLGARRVVVDWEAANDAAGGGPDRSLGAGGTGADGRDPGDAG